MPRCTYVFPARRRRQQQGSAYQKNHISRHTHERTLRTSGAAATARPWRLLRRRQRLRGDSSGPFRDGRPSRQEPGRGGGGQRRSARRPGPAPGPPASSGDLHGFGRPAQAPAAARCSCRRRRSSLARCFGCTSAPPTAASGWRRRPRTRRWRSSRRVA